MASTYKNSFRYRAVTGKYTIYVAILIAVLCWAVSYFVCDKTAASGVLGQLPLWTQYLLNLLCGLAVALFMNRLNGVFLVVREHTNAVGAFFLCLVSVFFFLHPLQPAIFVTLLVTESVYNLFICYQGERAALLLFRSFLFLGAASLLFPGLLYLLPIFFYGAWQTKATGIKVIKGAIIGLLTPYWFALAYLLFWDNFELVHPYLTQLVSFDKIDYSHIPLSFRLSLALVTLLFVSSVIYLFKSNYYDKVQTRKQLYFFSMLHLSLLALLLLQPAHFNVCITLQLLCVGFLAIRWFIFSQSRLASLFFYISLFTLLFIVYLSVWKSS